MDEESRKVFSDFVTDSRPEDQVKQFIDILRKPPYEIDITEDQEDSRTKYFGATKDGKSIFVLAHKSTTKDGWWGIGRSLVERVKKASENPRHNLSGWGAALIDSEPYRGYWINGEDFLELCDIGLISPNRNGLYEIHGITLRSQVDPAPCFSTIHKFLTLCGLTIEGR